MLNLFKPLKTEIGEIMSLIAFKAHYLLVKCDHLSNFVLKWLRPECISSVANIQIWDKAE